MTNGITYSQGSIVLVPFPFTNLSLEKKRPALVISPNWFNQCYQDRVLTAISSASSAYLTEQEDTIINIETCDIKEGSLHKKSIVKLTRIFTCAEYIIIKEIAQLKEEKLSEVLEKLRVFFGEQTTD